MPAIWFRLDNRNEYMLMNRYILTRAARALLTALLAVTFAFFILRLTGDPALEILGNEASP